jgi:hypothetical protein
LPFSLFLICHRAMSVAICVGKRIALPFSRPFRDT